MEDLQRFGQTNRRLVDYPDRGSTQRPLSTTSSLPTTTRVHVTALDGLVNVNSIFTIAVFVGLSFTSPVQQSLDPRPSCSVGVREAGKLLLFEVMSFSFFLFSLLVAQGLKLAINIINSEDANEAFKAHTSTRVLRGGMLASAVREHDGVFVLDAFNGECDPD